MRLVEESCGTELAIPERLEETILWCLQKDPGDRPSSVLELKTALSEIDLDRDWTQADAEAWWKRHGLDPSGKFHDIEPI
jgi:hypothetical protein